MRVLMMGCGKLGSAVGLGLAVRGHQVWGARRQVAQVPDALSPVQVHLQDGTGLDKLPRNLNLAVYCLSPSASDDESYAQVYNQGLQRFLNALPDNPTVLFISSTSVYHQSEHEWVDEQSPTQPERFAGKRLLEGEQLVATSGFTFTSVRFGGIYGPEPGRLLQQVRAGLVYPSSPLHYTNRIHFMDATAVLVHLASRALQGETLQSHYLATDCEPTPRHEVVDWLRTHLNIQQNQQSSEKVPESSQGAGSKRCRNQRLLESGYEFIYPDYRSGYQAVLENERL